MKIIIVRKGGSGSGFTSENGHMGILGVRGGSQRSYNRIFRSISNPTNESFTWIIHAGKVYTTPGMMEHEELANLHNFDVEDAKVRGYIIDHPGELRGRDLSAAAEYEAAGLKYPIVVIYNVLENEAKTMKYLYQNYDKWVTAVGLAGKDFTITVSDDAGFSFHVPKAPA